MKKLVRKIMLPVMAGAVLLTPLCSYGQSVKTAKVEKSNIATPGDVLNFDQPFGTQSWTEDGHAWSWDNSGWDNIRDYGGTMHSGSACAMTASNYASKLSSEGLLDIQGLWLNIQGGTGPFIRFNILGFSASGAQIYSVPVNTADYSFSYGYVTLNWVNVKSIKVDYEDALPPGASVFYDDMDYVFHAITTPPSGTAPATPGAITGPSNLCSSNGTGTYSIAAVTGATSYNWTVPAGATINSGAGTTSINVTFPASFTNGYVNVSATNTAGTSGIRSYHVIKTVPDMPGTITGPYNVCSTNGVGTYSIAAVTGAVSYTWTVPAGATINSGAGTTSINVTFPVSFSNGYVTVATTDACGSSNPRSYHVIKAVPAMPGAISGTTRICGPAGAAYSIAAVSGAAGYVWSVSGSGPQPTILGGQGTTSVLVSFPAGFVGTYLSVASADNCGSSNQRTLRILNCTYPASATSPNGDSYDETSANEIPMTTTGVDELNSSIKYVIYPNPNNGSFKLSFENSSSSELATIQVFNTLGEVVYSEVCSTSNEKEIKLEGAVKGIYLISVKVNGTINNKRIIVQ